MSYFKFKKSTQTIRLINVGLVPAIPAEQLKAGMKQMFNYSHVSTILKVIEKTPKTLSVIYYSVDPYTKEEAFYIADMRKTKLVAVSDQLYDISSYQPTNVKNYCGKNHGELIDVSQYFRAEHSKQVQNDAQETETISDKNTKLVTENEQTEHVSMSLNAEKNGIELKFNGKPSSETLEQLKIHGFRWSKYQKLWYAKQSEDGLNFANSIISVYNDPKKSQVGKINQPKTTAETENKIFSYPEIKIDDLDQYTISEELSKRENSSAWIFRTNETDWNKELHNILSEVQTNVLSVLSQTEDESIIYNLKKSLQYFKKHYTEVQIKWLYHRANNPSWAVTGRGNLNINKYNKAQDRGYNLLTELTTLKKDIENRIEKAENKINKQKENELFSRINAMDISDLNFITETRQIEGFFKPKRIYKLDNYSIVNGWGAWRIYHNGQEINKTLSTGTLTDAKKIVAYCLLQEQEKEAVNQ